MAEQFTHRQEELERRALNLRESLDTELKQWIEPSTPEGTAKIAKACIALRNNNGGCLFIGFTDAGAPHQTGGSSDVAAAFHVDAVQAIVSRFASQAFEIRIAFVHPDGAERPVICIPSGVETPVASKSELKDTNGQVLVKPDTVYVRSLNSNNTASTSPARAKDLDRLTKICFDNREADIGAFFRRHLSGLEVEKLLTLIENAAPVVNQARQIRRQSVHDLTVAVSNVAHVRNAYELRDVLASVSYNYPATTSLREIIARMSLSNVLDMGSQLICDIHTTEPEVAGIMATLLSTHLEMWNPTPAELKGCAVICRKAIRGGEYHMIGVIEPLAYSLAAKGEEAAYRHYLAAVLDHSPFRDADLERMNVYYGPIGTQIGAYVRHFRLDEPRGLLFANDVARVVELLNMCPTLGMRQLFCPLLYQAAQRLNKHGEARLAEVVGKVVAFHSAP